MEGDEQDREQVDSERESRGEREEENKSKETTNAQTCDDMCMSDFVRHTLRHLEPQGQKCRESLVWCICLDQDGDALNLFS